MQEPTGTTAEPSTCNTCPDVKPELLELEACRCKMDKWWDGNNCVDRTECPCVVDHITYKVGTSYKKEDCSECLCKIGGTSYCTPKYCDPCEKGWYLSNSLTTVKKSNYYRLKKHSNHHLPMHLPAMPR